MHSMTSCMQMDTPLLVSMATVLKVIVRLLSIVSALADVPSSWPQL